ncbi:riboflavin synthase subunit alpha [Fusobacterium vincentii]|nr:riboflavin synthase subunit alpha [Fusobacterium vincentii]
MSQSNFAVFKTDLSASLANLQQILDFLSLRNLLSNELFLLILHL